MQLVQQGVNVDKCIIVCFENKLDVIVGHSIFQDIVCLKQDGLVVCFVVYKDNVAMLINFFGHLHGKLCQEPGNDLLLGLQQQLDVGYLRCSLILAEDEPGDRHPRNLSFV